VVIGFVETLAGPVQVLEIRKVGAAWPACRLNLRGQKGLARAAEIPRVPGLCDVGHGLNHLARIQRQTDALLAIAILLSLIELGHRLNKLRLLDSVGYAKGLSTGNLPQGCHGAGSFERAAVIG
jgi:hypothetical protein